jgi:hypothetical protein
MLRAIPVDHVMGCDVIRLPTNRTMIGPVAFILRTLTIGCWLSANWTDMHDYSFLN